MEKKNGILRLLMFARFLSDTDNPRRYWSDLKRKLKMEGSELYEKIVQLKMTAKDGKQRMTDVADTEQLLNLYNPFRQKKQSHSNYG